MRPSWLYTFTIHSTHTRTHTNTHTHTQQESIEHSTAVVNNETETPSHLTESPLHPTVALLCVSGPGRAGPRRGVGCQRCCVGKVCFLFWENAFKSEKNKNDDDNLKKSTRLNLNRKPYLSVCVWECIFEYLCIFECVVRSLSARVCVCEAASVFALRH